MKTARVLIDLRCLDTASATRGIGRYARELVKALRRSAPRGFDLAGLSWSGHGARLGIEDVVFPGPRRGITLTDRYILPPLLRRKSIDLYHSTAYALPSAGAGGAALVLTLHDLAVDLHPDAVKLGQRLAFRRTYRSARVADRVVTISETTRKELLARYGVEPARVVSVLLGVTTGFDQRDAAGLPPSGFPRPYILYVGGLDRLKNVPFLLRVLERSRREEPGLHLVMAGEEGRRLRDFQDEARRTGQADRLITAGYLEDRRLAAAYREAAAFVFPSLYEGFGLPPLEAMAAGCPVVASGAGALREVLGEAALIAAPDDAEAWAGAIRTVLRDREARERLVLAGRARSARFTWEQTARGTLEVYQDALLQRRAA